MSIDLCVRKLPLFFLLLLALASCGGPVLPDPTPTATIPAATWTASPIPSATAPPYRPGYWTVRTPFHWSHDGRPFESEHFTVYSDGATLGEKERFAAEAEEAFEFIIDFLGITESELCFPAAPGKLEIYAATGHANELEGGFAYYGGFLFAYDQSDYRTYGLRWPDSFLFGPLFTHEITHDVAFLLVGPRSSDSLLVATWFDEGLAVLVSDDVPYHLDTLSRLNLLREELAGIPGAGNPTLIGVWEEIPYQYFTDEMMNKLYALFGLSVRYLAETYGVETCARVYLDVRGGMPFDEAFMNQYGMSVGEYQETFFSRMEEYLP